MREVLKADESLLSAEKEHQLQGACCGGNWKNLRRNETEKSKTTSWKESYMEEERGKVGGFECLGGAPIEDEGMKIVEA